MPHVMCRSRCWPWGTVRSEVSKGSVSAKHWPTHVGLYLVKWSFGVPPEQAEHL